MKALTWHGKRDVRVEEVPDPTIEAAHRRHRPDHLDRDLRLRPAPVRGARPVPRRPATSSDTSRWASSRRSAPRSRTSQPGDRVVVPFNISCGHCWMCERRLYAQCETTQVREQGKGAALFGYTTLYGQVPGGQAEYLRVPQAHFGPIKVPHEGPDERYLFLSDVLPTAWQALRTPTSPPGGTLAVIGLGPIGQMSRPHRPAPRGRTGHRRRQRAASGSSMAQRHGVEVVDTTDVDDVAATLIELADGRGPDAVIDAVGMEAHGSPAATFAQRSRRPAARRGCPDDDRHCRRRPAGRAAHRDQGGAARRHGLASSACTAARSTRCR